MYNNPLRDTPETLYSLFEVQFIPHDGSQPFTKNLLFPTVGWSVELDKYEAEIECERGRTLCLAHNIEVSPYHNFNDS